jgi:predicted ATPase
MGGVGKTRLVTKAAREVSGLFPDGAAFVGLAPLSEPSLVIPTVSRSLGLPRAEGPSPVEALVDQLGDKNLLLVLDNLEHVLGAAQEVAALVEGCPRLVVMATSRAPLRVRGEQEYPVGPLELPASTRSPTAEDVVNSPSGRLFAERARAAAPTFDLTAENAWAVASICWRLAGLPLALELAAAKTKFLDPATLLSRLDRALSGAGARDLPERQRTMRATLDWSHDLLRGPQRVLLWRLSAFAGGFTLEASEAVGAGPGAAGSVGGEEVLDLLGALVEQSLVTARTGTGERETRYGMLEPVRQYALEKLEQSGEAEETRRRHAAFYLKLAERAEPELRGPRQISWLDRLERENDDIRAVVSRALSAGDYDTAARLGWALRDFWWLHGHHREARRWLRATLEHELSSALRARALHAAASAAFALGDYPAAEEYWREVLLLSQSEGDVLVEGNAWAGMGLVEMVRANHETAGSNWEKSIALHERCGEEYLASVSRVFLGTTLLARGKDERAKREFEGALASARRLKTPVLTYVALYNAAQSALARGDREETARLLGEGIEWSGRTKDRAYLAHLLEASAALAAFGGEAERSALLLGAAEALLEEVGAHLHNYYVTDPFLRERAVDKAREDLGEAAFERARGHGRTMTFDQAVAYALGNDATRGDSVTW